ncbi:uncharacterized protein LOC142339470 [Convolutriloba macropyga]|uniref:uncharacterized protein LOC142339470 n=1 Tax=Convolutriloba macropyga TaxID=536237 RepID=UPI003F524E94
MTDSDTATAELTATIVIVAIGVMAILLFLLHKMMSCNSGYGQRYPHDVNRKLDIRKRFDYRYHTEPNPEFKYSHDEDTSVFCNITPRSRNSTRKPRRMNTI